MGITPKSSSDGDYQKWGLSNGDYQMENPKSSSIFIFGFSMKWTIQLFEYHHLRKAPYKNPPIQLSEMYQ